MGMGPAEGGGTLDVAAALGGSRHFAAIVVVAVIIVPIAAFTVN